MKDSVNTLTNVYVGMCEIETLFSKVNVTCGSQCHVYTDYAGQTIILHLELLCCCMIPDLRLTIVAATEYRYEDANVHVSRM